MQGLRLASDSFRYPPIWSLHAHLQQMILWGFARFKFRLAIGRDLTHVLQLLCGQMHGRFSRRLV